MRDAVRNGKAFGRDLALLEDRVALGTGNRQKYGSQLERDPQISLPYLLPIDDPDQVDERRQKIGLSTMTDCLALFNLKWDLEAYKKALPELEKKLKAQSVVQSLLRFKIL